MTSSYPNLVRTCYKFAPIMWDNMHRDTTERARDNVEKPTIAPTNGHAAFYLTHSLKQSNAIYLQLELVYNSMSYSCINGRLRTLPIIDNDASKCEQSDAFISVTPYTLPQGLITMHQVTPSPISSSHNDSDNYDRCKDQRQIMNLSSLGILETYRFMGKSIIDHCWTTAKLDPGRNAYGGKVLILAVLVRNRGGMTVSSESSDDSQVVSLEVSSIIVQWRPCDRKMMGQTRRDTIDEQFPHRTVIHLPFLACSIAMNEHLLVIGTMAGAIFHKIEHIVAPQSTSNSFVIRYDDLERIKVMKTFVVHAMDISALHFVGVSGAHIGVWNVTDVLKSFEYNKESCPAAWSTTLDSKQRVTCVRFCALIESRLIALACWDGSAILLRQKEGSKDWLRVVNTLNEDDMAPWEYSVEGSNDLCPCFLEILGFRGNIFLVITTPSSSLVRIFDIESGDKQSFGTNDGNDIQGLVKISFCASTSLQEELIAYIDGSDMINFLSVKWIQSKFLRSICLNFQIADITANISISPLKGGLINDTYRVSVDTSSSYVLQRVNTNVFRDYDKLMQNISTVLDHIQLKSKGSIAHILVLIPTLSGEFYWSRSAKNDAVEVWRMYNYIPNSVTYPVATNLDILYEAGKAYGRFQCCVQDILPFSLYETIPDFHNTPKRLEALRKAFSEDICHRADDVQEEIEFIERNSWLAYSIVNLLDDGTLPKRIIHNDTKLENVLFDKYSNHALCVIDYDTVMPNGSMLYDFGDATRSMASSSSEDEQDLTKVRFEINRYKYFTEGFLREVITIITEHEITMLPMGAIVITLEQAIRFLTDYLVGDVYFKVAFSEHNLVRTKNQLKLVKEMLEKKEYMEEIISNYCRNFDNKKSEI